MSLKRRATEPSTLSLCRQIRLFSSAPISSAICRMPTGLWDDSMGLSKRCPTPISLSTCMCARRPCSPARLKVRRALSSGLAHAQFETIHPFLDGNGRIGRLLITFLLCEREALKKPVLYLSYYFKKHRQQYYDHLQAIRDDGDWESWLAFFLQGVAEVSLEAADTAKKILVRREDHRRKINEHLGRTAGNGHKVLEQLYEKPIVSVDDVRAITGTTFQAANVIVQRLVGLEILKEMTGRARNRRFLYAPYVNLFT